MHLRADCALARICAGIKSCRPGQTSAQASPYERCCPASRPEHVSTGDSSPETPQTVTHVLGVGFCNEHVPRLRADQKDPRHQDVQLQQQEGPHLCQPAHAPQQLGRSTHTLACKAWICAQVILSLPADLLICPCCPGGKQPPHKHSRDCQSNSKCWMHSATGPAFCSCQWSQAVTVTWMPTQVSHVGHGCSHAIRQRLDCPAQPDAWRCWIHAVGPMQPP